MGLVEQKGVVILGGTSGIGAASAELLVAEGASVVIAGRRVDTGEDLASRLGSRASFARCDVLVERQVRELMNYAGNSLGRVDGLINCAGDGGASGGVTALDLQAASKTLDLHLGGTLAAMKHAAPIMLEQGAGSIVNVTSIGGHIAGWTGIAYASAKAAALQATRCAAVELGENGVRVNSVSPGPTLTGIFAKGAGIDPGVADREAGRLEPVFTAALASWQTLRRAGVPSDVAPAIVWLISDETRFVNGHDIVVDGGISAGRPASVSLGERTQMAAVFQASVQPAAAGAS